MERIALHGNHGRQAVPLVAFAMALLIIGTFAYWPALTRGGFVLDDWAAAARVLNPSPGQTALSATLDVAGPRVVQVPYVVGTFALLGTDAQAHIVLATVIGFATALLFFVLLRAYCVPGLLAGGAAALFLVLPAGAAPKVWPAVAPDEIALLFFFAGMLVARSAFMRASIRLHLVSILLFVIAVFTKELPLPWIAASLVWYLPVVGRKRAVRRWLADLGVVAVGAGVGLAFPAPAQTRTALDTWDDHARALAESVGETLWDTVTLYQVGKASSLLMLVATAILAVLAVVIAQSSGTAWSGIKVSATTLAAGLLGLFLAYAIYIPANPALLPDIPGPLGRPGAGGAAAASLAVAALVAVLAAALSAGFTRYRTHPRAADAVLAAALVAVIAGATLQTRREVDAWATTAARESDVLAAVGAQVPNPAAGITFVILGAPGDVLVSRGDSESVLTVFLEPFVSTAAVRTHYARSDVFGIVIRPGDRLRCTAEALVIERPGFPFPITAAHEAGTIRSIYGLGPAFHRPGSLYNVPSARYGTVRVVDLRGPDSVAPLTRKACRVAVGLTRT